MKIVLISTYELGRQPFGLASPAAWLRRAGAKVTCLDTAVQRLPRAPVQEADLIAFYVPMHTATRKAIRLLEHVRRINSHAPLCFYGLYAPVNASFLRRLGADAILGGEFEQGLVQWVEKWSSPERVQRNDDSGASTVNLKRQQFIPPDRSGLPALEHYARLTLPDGQQRLAGYTEASRGCKHLCRHCPVVPVYQGQFRIVQPDVILADIAAQVEMGAQHITFGDPDFFNGVKHGLTVIQALHRNHPQLSYDVTIKIEHLLKYSHHLETLRRTGCLFVTSAVESIDDRVLRLLDKHHTQEDFLRVVRLFREADLTLSPTFVPFTPWTSLEDYQELLALLGDQGLVDQVSPIQLVIRLLIPAGSRLLELTELQGLISEFDEQALSYRWSHPDPRMDALQARLLQFVNNAECRGLTRQEIFASIWDLVHEVTPVHQIPRVPPRVSRAAIPYLNEPWYC
ncbi:MAG TPA: CUAEP/CCAEP-tail radical SAM protein [Terriglobia bacterium]|nr:CUAEP/CCAEP-tail radical SAM protein [Terriglobia bacterium]